MSGSNDIIMKRAIIEHKCVYLPYNKHTTPWGQNKMSCLTGCPDFKDCEVHKHGIQDNKMLAGILWCVRGIDRRDSSEHIHVITKRANYLCTQTSYKQMCMYMYMSACT